MHKKKMETERLHHIQKLSRNWIIYLNTKAKKLFNFQKKKKKIKEYHYDFKLVKNFLGQDTNSTNYKRPKKG